MIRTMFVLALSVLVFSGCDWFKPKCNNSTCGHSDVVHDESQPSKVVKIKDKAHLDQLLKTEQSVVVNFSAPWCVKCKFMKPVNEKVAATFENIKIVKVDLGELEGLGQEYDIMGLPTFIFFKNGEKVGEPIVGNIDEARYEVEIKNRFGS